MVYVLVMGSIMAPIIIYAMIDDRGFVTDYEKYIDYEAYKELGLI